MTKEKKEEGAEGAPLAKLAKKLRPRATRKPPLPATKKPRPSPKPRREEEEIIYCGGCRFARAWKMFFSSWVWGIPARITRRRGTTPDFCSSKNWRRSGSADWTNERKFQARVAKAERRRQESFAGRAADVHEFERRVGRGAGEVLSVAAGEDFGGGGRCGFAVGRNPAAAGRQQRRASRIGIRRRSIWRRENFARLRIGIGRKNEARQITGHVLGKFSAAESALLEKVLERAADQIECWLSAGIEKAMSQFNGVVDSTNEEK